MISNIFYPYKDEILYSWIVRYHKYNLNNFKNQTLQDLYNTRHQGLSIHYPNRILSLVENLNTSHIHIDAEFILNNMTFIKIIKPFYPKERYEKAKEALLTSSNLGYRYHGFHLNDILRDDKDTIKVCPVCFKEDTEEYGEAFLHRSHNVIGVKTCYKHKCYLEKFRFNFRNNYFWDINSNYVYKEPKFPSEELMHNYDGLANDMNFLLEYGLDNYTPEIIQDKIQTKLLINGIYNSPNSKNHPILINFLKFYGEDFLEELGLNYSLEDKIIWLRNILHQKLRKNNPIKWILILRFLFGSLKKFSEYNEKFIPFGKSPYPCLNNICKYHKKSVINEYTESTTDDLKYLIGTFKCNYCGFIYTRRNDLPSEKKYTYTKVKERGWLWKKRLKESILKGEESPTLLGEKFNIDKRDIIKYANDFGLEDLINSSQDIEHKGYSPNYTIELKTYKKKLIEYIQNHPNDNRSRVIENNRKEYGTIYSRDKKWIEDNMPAPVPKEKMKRRNYDDEFWINKDNIISKKIKAEVNKIFDNKEKVKITKSLLSQRIRYTGIMHSKFLNRMPKSKKLINKYTESVEDYKKRKKEIKEL
jgi:hypothetical protein